MKQLPYGHNHGDQVLIEISPILKKETRTTDIMVRWKGEEFLLFLPEQN